jgi:hypothetical protein
VTGRPLTPGEIALAASVFGAAIDYDRARIAHRKWAFFQPRHIVMAPRGCIHFNPRGDLYRDDFATADVGLQSLFIHEMTHIWQHQSGVNLVLKRHPFCRYAYALKPGQAFRRYGLEQQAEIARHTFLLRRGASVPGAPGLSAYDSLMPFRPMAIA